MFIKMSMWLNVSVGMKTFCQNCHDISPFPIRISGTIEQYTRFANFLHNCLSWRIIYLDSFCRLGSVSEIFLAGAISTGIHGTGSNFGPLATSISFLCILKTFVS